MNRNLESMARTGYVAKGAVYGITGMLTFLAAFNLGGQKTGQLEVLDFLDEQTFGNLLLIIMGLGLLCYAGWRFIQSFSDPEGIGTDKKAKVKRTAFFVSGCTYMGLGGIALWRAFSSGPSESSGNSQASSTLLGSDTGLVILGAVGIIFIATGIYQFVRAYKKEFLKEFNFDSIKEEKRRKAIKNSAYMGMGSRGILFLIIGYFALRAAITSNPSEIKTTLDAFSFLEESNHGPILLGLVAAGLVGYAFYMFMMAKYRRFRG